MSRFFTRRLITASVAGVLSAGLLGAPAHAGPRSPDPELVQRADAHEHETPSSARVVPATIDSDVDAFVTAHSIAYFVVAGRLQLQLRSGSTTTYTGSFVDYVGNKSYKASADATNPGAPTLKLKSKNGTFEFLATSSFGGSYWSGTGTSVPSKLKVSAEQVYLGAAPHSATTTSYAIRLTERSGAINNPFQYTGSLTLVHDANFRISGGSITVSNSKGKIVTNPVNNSGSSNGGSFYTVAKVDKTYFGLTGTVSGTTLGGYGFGGSGAKTTQWVLNGTA